MRKLSSVLSIAMLLMLLPFAAMGKTPVKKVLFIGDSMTGWMGERFGAYGDKNGFSVATYTWDGSTIKKWADTPRLKSIVEEQDPDVVFVCLGMNDMFQRNPEQAFGASLTQIKRAISDREMVWVGPPSWPGKNLGNQFNDWMNHKLGRRFFNSSELTLPRQSKSNPHPTRAGIIQWVDEIVEWLGTNPNLSFPSLDKPEANEKQMSRGKVFVYKRMKEKL